MAKKAPIERIKEAVNVRELMSYYGAQHMKGSGDIRSCCPIHLGDNKTAFVFNEEKKVYYCHTHCGGGDFIDFVMNIEECTFLEAVHKIVDLFHIEIDWENETVEENYFRDEARDFINKMMKRNKKVILPEFKVKGMKFTKVKSYRGYSEETIDWWKFRYCTEGELKDRIVIPFEDVEKRLVGITGRATLEEQAEKFMHRPRNLHTGYFLTGLGRNLEFVREAGNRVKIVEGVFDCARWWDNGYKNICAPIGLFFTEEHILELYKAGVTCIELGFDNDKAGRNGIRKAIKKATGKFDIYVLDYPEGKDADDCSKEELEAIDANKLLAYEWLKKYGEELE